MAVIFQIPNNAQKSVIKNVYYLIAKYHFTRSLNRIPRLGIGGPVGSGKTMLIEQVVPNIIIAEVTKPRSYQMMWSQEKMLNG